MRRSLVTWTVLVAPCTLGACGSVRTALPAKVAPSPPLEAAAADPTTARPPASDPATTASAFRSPGEKHALSGGTLAVSYPRVGVRPPKGSAPVPPGHAWAVVNVRFCAASGAPLARDLVDPFRFRAEVPGQGSVRPPPDAPALAKAPLLAGAIDVAPRACVEGSIAYLVAGEGHIEAITYDTGAGLLRWAT